MQYKCLLCNYVYDEDAGDPKHNIEPGTKWEDVPDEFVCPDCGATKLDFEKL